MWTLWQFSTSHYCRKARLALGVKKVPYTVRNLTPGLHLWTTRRLVGLDTLPVLEGPALALGDTTQILQYLETYQPHPTLLPPDPKDQALAWQIEDWADESLGTATRFVYYAYRSGAGRFLDTSPLDPWVIRAVQRKYRITPASTALAEQRLAQALVYLAPRWQDQWLVADQFTVADLSLAALLSPLARIPSFREASPWLFAKIAQIHDLCGEALPPGL